MRSSISSSDPRARHPLWASVLLGLATFALLAAPEWWLSFPHARRVISAKKSIEQLMPLSDSGPGEAEFEHVRRVLHARPRRAVVFVGNSILRTGALPAAMRDGLGVAPDVRVLHVGLDGYPPGLPFEAILNARWQPELLVVDLEPRNFRLPRSAEVRNLLREPRSDRGERIEPALANAVHAVLPFAAQPRSPGEQLRRVELAWSDPELLQLLYARRVEGFVGLDGSKPTWLFEDSPSARADSLERSRFMIRSNASNARPVLKRFLDGARHLARRGTRVVFISMPTSPRLRAIDAEVNAANRSWFLRRIARIDGVDFVDLGADPQLAAMPFFDGHHRAFPVAIEASQKIAERLAAYVPAALREADPTDANRFSAP